MNNAHENFAEQAMALAMEHIINKSEDKKIFIPKEEIEAMMNSTEGLKALKFDKSKEGLTISYATSAEISEEIANQMSGSIIDKILDNIAPIDFGAGRKGRF